MRLVILVIFSFIASICFSAVLAGQNPEIVIREIPRAWASRSSVPLYVDVRSPRGGRLTVAVESSNDGKRAVTRTVDIPANTPVRLEMTASVGYSAHIRCEGLGTTVSRRVSMPSFGYSDRYDGGAPSSLACVDSFLLRELQQATSTVHRGSTEVMPINLDELPGRWQAYSGFLGMLAMDVRETRMLRPEQRQALARWVRWFGGSVYIAGEDARAAAADIGLDVAALKPTLENGLERYRLQSGFVFLQTVPDARAVLLSLPEVQYRSPIAHYYGGGSTPGHWLLEPFGGVSTTLIIATLIILGIVMGPLNYLYIRRKRNSLLFFITTPAIALAGTVAIFASSVLGEGLGGEYAQDAVLVRAAGGEDAMVFDIRGVKSGFYAATPRFSAESEVLPIRNSYEDVDLSVDVTDGVVLTSGWLRPRFPSGFLVAKPVFSRMNVEVGEENGEYYVTNGLGFPVELVAARLPDGFGWAENVAPGARTRLRRESAERRLDRLKQDMERAFGGYRFENVDMVARCGGLPYLEDGGINASRVQGAYHYVVVGEGKGRADR